MTYDKFLLVLKEILESREAQALALSKGGWEGWLQCELWNRVSDSGITIERELKYPGFNTYCDLICSLDKRECWIELKAFGYLREVDINTFLDSFANDVLKLDAAPKGAAKLALLVIPRNIGEKATLKIYNRWPAIQVFTLDVMDLFLLKFE